MPKLHPLTLVATPIGNLAEVSPLAKKTLAEAAIIICEDTRVTKKLLVLLNIDCGQKLISFHKLNEQLKTKQALALLAKQPCVLVSDAGYPVISDPGYHLVNTIRKLGGQIRVVNGPCAFIHALVQSGVDSRKFFFANFLPKKVIARTNELKELKQISHLATIIYYEAVNYLATGLKLLQNVFGDIKIGISRELSKINETFYFDTISNLMNQVVYRGEFVIIIPRQQVSVSSLT